MKVRPYLRIAQLSIVITALLCISPIPTWAPVTYFCLFLCLYVLGAIFIQWNFYVLSFHKGKNAQYLALTFDDGPAKESDAILDILKHENVPAAFFIIGQNAKDRPEVVRRYDAEGHIVGNHSFYHGFHFDWKSTPKMIAEIEQCNETIKDVIGKQPKLFRPPYGVTNPNLSRAITATKMHSIGWSLRSFDTKAKSPQQLLDRILGKLKGGDIILLHDSMPITKEILTDLITRARQKGFIFVGLDKLIDVQAYA